MLIEDVEDCPPVECWMWQKVAVSCGYFEGIRRLSFADLLELRSLCDHQMQQAEERLAKYESGAYVMVPDDSARLDWMESNSTLICVSRRGAVPAYKIDMLSWLGDGKTQLRAEIDKAMLIYAQQQEKANDHKD